MPDLPLLQGPRNRECTLCSLSEGAGANRCIPLTLHPSCQSSAAMARDPLLLVGMNPGRAEMREDRPFVGPSGQLLDRVYLNASGLLSLTCVWLTNASRCWTPLTEQPKVSHRNACSRAWMPQDLAFLRTNHPSCPTLNVLCLGADAADTMLRLVRLTDKSFAKGSSPLSFLLKNQGTLTPALPVPGHEGWVLRLWGTYHPAYLLREGGVQMPAVSGHLSLLVHTLSGAVPVSTPPTLVPPFDPTP